MNIFFLDWCPKKAAQHQHNRHCVKMLLETAQLLSTTRRVLIGQTDVCKSTHVNHPSAIWARESLGNYRWLFQHYFELAKEYTYRYGRFHQSLKLFMNLHPDIRPISGLVSPEMTPIRLAMPDKYKTADPVESYRAYYIGEKIQGNFWTHRRQSELDGWLTDHLTDSQFKLPKQPK